MRKNNLNDSHIIGFYLFLIAIYILVLIGKKIYYKIQKRDYWIVPHLKINSISGISMTTSMNIALIIAISLLSNQLMGIFFKVYPGARFLIENVLIKLGGILFGPLIGIFIGFVTDLMTVIFTSSVLNYGYFFSAMMNGFFGGLLHLIIHIKDPTKVKPAAVTIAIATFALCFLGYVLGNNSDHLGNFSARILSISLSVHWSILFIIMFFLICGVGFCLLNSVYALNRMHDPKHSYVPSVKFFSNKYLFFLILLSNCSIYILVDIIALPMFDVNLSTLPYEQFVISRFIASIPSILLFSYLIHYIYKLHSSIKQVSSNATDIEVGLQPIAMKRKKENVPILVH